MSTKPHKAAPRDHVGVAFQARCVGEQGERSQSQRDQLGADLRVGQAETRALEVDLRPGWELVGFPPAAIAGERLPRLTRSDRDPLERRRRPASAIAVLSGFSLPGLLLLPRSPSAAAAMLCRGARDRARACHGAQSSQRCGERACCDRRAALLRSVRERTERSAQRPRMLRLRARCPAPQGRSCARCESEQSARASGSPARRTAGAAPCLPAVSTPRATARWGISPFCPSSPVAPAERPASPPPMARPPEVPEPLRRKELLTRAMRRPGGSKSIKAEERGFGIAGRSPSTTMLS